MADTKSRTERIESIVLVLIVVVVALASAWASFSHVKHWTMNNVPVGTPDLFGWVNACVSELVPVASFLEMKRRKRLHISTRLPQVLFFSALALSLSAQLAVAEQTITGWLLSAVPALAFIGLSKMAMSSTYSKSRVTATSVMPIEPIKTLRIIPLVAPNSIAPEAPAVAPTPRKAVARRAAPRPAAPKTRRPLDESIAMLLQLETENPGISAVKLAEKLGVSTKQIRNYRGHPLYAEMKSGSDRSLMAVAA